MDVEFTYEDYLIKKGEFIKQKKSSWLWSTRKGNFLNVLLSPRSGVTATSALHEGGLPMSGPNHIAECQLEGQRSR